MGAPIVLSNKQTISKQSTSLLTATTGKIAVCGTKVHPTVCDHMSQKIGETNTNTNNKPTPTPEPELTSTPKPAPTITFYPHSNPNPNPSPTQTPTSTPTPQQNLTITPNHNNPTQTTTLNTKTQYTIGNTQNGKKYLVTLIHPTRIRQNSDNTITLLNLDGTPTTTGTYQPENADITIENAQKVGDNTYEITGQNNQTTINITANTYHPNHSQYIPLVQQKTGNTNTIQLDNNGTPKNPVTLGAQTNITPENPADTTTINLKTRAENDMLLEEHYNQTMQNAYEIVETNKTQQYLIIATKNHAKPYKTIYYNQNDQYHIITPHKTQQQYQQNEYWDALTQAINQNAGTPNTPDAGQTQWTNLHEPTLNTTNWDGGYAIPPAPQKTIKPNSNQILATGNPNQPVQTKHTTGNTTITQNGTQIHPHEQHQIQNPNQNPHLQTGDTITYRYKTTGPHKNAFTNATPNQNGQTTHTHFKNTHQKGDKIAITHNGQYNPNPNQPSNITLIQTTTPIPILNETTITTNQNTINIDIPPQNQSIQNNPQQWKIQIKHTNPQTHPGQHTYNPQTNTFTNQTTTPTTYTLTDQNPTKPGIQTQIPNLQTNKYYTLTARYQHNNQTGPWATTPNQTHTTQTYTPDQHPIQEIYTTYPGRTPKTSIGIQLKTQNGTPTKARIKNSKGQYRAHVVKTDHCDDITLNETNTTTHPITLKCLPNYSSAALLKTKLPQNGGAMTENNQPKNQGSNHIAIFFNGQPQHHLKPGKTYNLTIKNNILEQVQQNPNGQPPTITPLQGFTIKNAYTVPQP